MANDASRAADKVGTAVDDSAITAKVKTALLADPNVKGLQIDVDTKNGVVTLNGTADKPANRDRAVAIAKDTSGVKSVENRLVVKASS
jgi:hyperosmotically inducible protein